MRRVLSVSVVFAAGVIALLASFAIGPLGSMPEVVRIDESYVGAVRNQYLFAGLLASLATIVAAGTLKVSLRTVVAILIVCGIAFPILAQLSEPDFPSQVGSAIVEFLIPYGAVCALMLAIVAGAKVLVSRGKPAGSSS